MPFTFNGIGTTYYGKRDIYPDSSFVTTEWLVFVYLPLLPIRSLRVLPTGQSTHIVVYNSQGYLTHPVPLCWPQVRNVYAVAGVIIAIIFGLFWIMSFANS